MFISGTGPRLANCGVDFVFVFWHKKNKQQKQNKNYCQKMGHSTGQIVFPRIGIGLPQNLLPQIIVSLMVSMSTILLVCKLIHS